VKNVVGICIGIAIMVIPVVLFFVGLHQYLQSISVVIWIPLLSMYELIVLAIILLYIVNYEDCKNKD
jgi:NADH:ubiquinone oxidoreductase subunit K